MVFNGKLIVITICLFVLMLGLAYATFFSYSQLRHAKEELQQVINEKKQLKEAYDEELAEQARLNKYKTSTIDKLKRDYKNEPCFNDNIPDGVIDSLYYKKK